MIMRLSVSWTHDGHSSLVKTVLAVVVLSMLEGTSFGVPVLKGSSTKDQTQTHHHHHRHSHSIVKRASSEFTNFENTYTRFHNHLKSFVEALPDRLALNAPDDLSTNVGAVTEILQPGEKAFAIHDMKTLNKRAKMTIKVVKRLLEKLKECRYMGPDNQDWLNLVGSSLDLNMTIVNFNLEKWIKSGTDFYVTSGGVGGINKGVNVLNPHVIEKMKALLKALLC